VHSCRCPRSCSQYNTVSQRSRWQPQKLDRPESMSNFSVSRGEKSVELASDVVTDIDSDESKELDSLVVEAAKQSGRVG
jgi:hypothetical protein